MGAGDPDQRRGEIVLIVAGSGDVSAAPGLELDAVLDVLLPELPPARAAAVAARLTGVSRREAYTRALQRQPAE